MLTNSSDEFRTYNFGPLKKPILIFAAQIYALYRAVIEM
jgi:hypothetical protein